MATNIDERLDRLEAPRIEEVNVMPATKPTPGTKRERSKPRERKPSHKWASIQEVADHFRVGRETVRAGRGVFARLRRVTLTAGRTVIPRADFERLDRELERAAQPLAGEVVQLDERRKSA